MIGMREKIVYTVGYVIGIPFLIFVITYLLIPGIRALSSTPERPMFSERFIRDGLTSRWATPILFSDKVGNMFAIDTEMNSVLVCCWKNCLSRPENVGVSGLPHGYFKIVFQPKLPPDYFTPNHPELTGGSPLLSKAIVFRNWEDTGYIVSGDDLTFNIVRLRQGATADIKKRAFEGCAKGKEVPDFIGYLHDFIVKDVQNENGGR